jgi:hypothetical protein
MIQLLTYLHAHPNMVTGLTLFGYHVLSAFVGSLQMPNAKSGNGYRFFFNFANVLAANYSRARASSGVMSVSDIQPPKGAA